MHVLLKDLSASHSVPPDFIYTDSHISNVSQLHTITTSAYSQHANAVNGTYSNSSVHQQDNSSEDTSIGPLPKMNKFIIIPELWMELSM